MSIVNFIESIKNDRRFNTQIVEHKYLYPVKARYMKLVIPERLKDVLKGWGITQFGEVYDGDTTAHRRKKIREAIPNVIFTNPDMLHLAINPFHKKWETFFKKLRFVVIDEIHIYRGVFGSNVAHVIRRLRRICRYWGGQSSVYCSLCCPCVISPKLILYIIDIL